MLSDQAMQDRKPWCLSTSIILIVFATLVLVVSLVRADQLQVISNGLLLGGVFSMLYGVGWIAFTGTSVLRFLVMTVALGITVGLGYVRFVRRGRVRRVIPSRATWPALAAIRPARHFINVVFPMPLAPISPQNAPERISRSRPDTTHFCPT